MKADSPSRTARLVAFGRALADAGLSNVPGFTDPTAAVFLGDESGLPKMKADIHAGKRGVRLRYLLLMADIMALRTLAIDAAVRDAITRGATQLVILGAGYDGRAWRMPELAGVKVFEVDHPATQEAKRQRAARLGAPAGALTFVPVNFERDSLREALDAAGHDASAPTCWIWEGVVMYLTADAMRGTLRDIAARSAPRSTLIVNYHSRQRRSLMRLAFRFIGEPMISAWSPEEMAAELRAVGFSVLGDSGMDEWNARWADGRAPVHKRTFVRVAVASPGAVV